MSNTTFGPGEKKETVYSGTSPQPRQGGSSAPGNGSTAYGSVPQSGGTFHNGLGAGSTVYNNAANSGTVYTPPAQKAVARPVAATAFVGGIKNNIFFLIAGISVINTLLIVGKAPFVFALGLAITGVAVNGQLGAVLVLNAIAVGVFALLGIFAARGVKAAFLIGLLLYAGDTGVLLLSDNVGAHVVSVIFHGVFLFSIFKAYRQVN